MGLDTISVCAADFLFSVSVRVHIFYSDRRSWKIRLLSLSNWENVASLVGMVGALRSFTSCLQLAQPSAYSIMKNRPHTTHLRLKAICCDGVILTNNHAHPFTLSPFYCPYYFSLPLFITLISYATPTVYDIKAHFELLQAVRIKMSAAKQPQSVQHKGKTTLTCQRDDDDAAGTLGQLPHQAEGRAQRCGVHDDVWWEVRLKKKNM